MGVERGGVSYGDLWQGSQSFISEPIPRGWACLSLLGTIVRLQIIETKSKCTSQVGELVLQKPFFSVPSCLLPDGWHCTPALREPPPPSRLTSVILNQSGELLFGWEGFITLCFSKWQIHVIPLPWGKNDIRENSHYPLFLSPQPALSVGEMTDTCWMESIQSWAKGLTGFFRLSLSLSGSWYHVVPHCELAFLRIGIHAMKVSSNLLVHS